MRTWFKTRPAATGLVGRGGGPGGPVGATAEVEKVAEAGGHFDAGGAVALRRQKHLMSVRGKGGKAGRGEGGTDATVELVLGVFATGRGVVGVVDCV